MGRTSYLHFASADRKGQLSGIGEMRHERLNGTSKDRTKTMRAYENLEGAAALWQVHFNLVRPHLAPGKTPGEAAGIAGGLGTFRWRAIIEQATRGRREEPHTE